MLSEALRRRAGDGDAGAATDQRRRADALAERLGIVVLVDRIVAPAAVWSLQGDDGDWLLLAGDERARLHDGRGVHYLRMLLAAPGQEIAALDLVAGGAGLAAPSAAPVLDDEARAAYQRRLAALDGELDAADRAGDADRARAGPAGTGRPGGRAPAFHWPRRPVVARATGESERARVNVTRTLRATIARLGPAAPRAAAHLQASVRTGRLCCYQAAPGGPSRWRL